MMQHMQHRVVRISNPREKTMSWDSIEIFQNTGVVFKVFKLLSNLLPENMNDNFTA